MQTSEGKYLENRTAAGLKTSRSRIDRHERWRCAEREMKECSFLWLVSDTAAVRLSCRTQRFETRKPRSTGPYPSAALRVIIGGADNHDAGFRH
jgi:hypothetical protein